MITTGIDYLALNVPDLEAQVERIVTSFGMVIEHRFDRFALLSGAKTGSFLSADGTEIGSPSRSQAHSLCWSNRSVISAISAPSTDLYRCLPLTAASSPMTGEAGAPVPTRRRTQLSVGRGHDRADRGNR